MSYLLPSENGNDDQQTVRQQTILARRVRHARPFSSCPPPHISGDARCLLLLPGFFSSITQSFFDHCAFAHFALRSSMPDRLDFPSRKQSRHFFFFFSTLAILSKGYSRNKPRKRYGFSVSLIEQHVQFSEHNLAVVFKFVASQTTAGTEMTRLFGRSDDGSGPSSTPLPSMTTVDGVVG
jgi:hypothetical protein